MEWTLGITDTGPEDWRIVEPQWDDEQLTVSSVHTFYEMMGELAVTAILKRRGSDSGLNDHLWNLIIEPWSQALKTGFRFQGYDSDAEEEDEDDRPTKVLCPMEMEQIGDEREDDDGRTLVSPMVKLSPGLLPKDTVIKATYDYGSTTCLYLKVLSVQPAPLRAPLRDSENNGPAAAQEDALAAVPAYNIPKEQQLDAYYPYFAKAFLSHGSATLGKSSCLSSETDSTFCSIEDATSSSDVTTCGMPFRDMDEFLMVAEQAWTPSKRKREDDPEQVDQYRSSHITRFLIPSCSEVDEAYQRLQDVYADFPYGEVVFSRLAREEVEEKKQSITFEFAKSFPKTYAHFQSGKFRWIKYKADVGVLRVVVGRGIGSDSREFHANQVLQTWKRRFSSLHELLCAVETSWVQPNNHKEELPVDLVLPEFDVDLGPSRPGPKEPPCYGTETECIVVSKGGNDSKKLVTALAISEENGFTFLYSGHDDGTLVKWCLDDNTKTWSKQIYPDQWSQRESEYIGLSVDDTPGVAGIVVRQSRKEKEGGLIYTWTNSDNDGEEPCDVKCWSSRDGSHQKSFVCDIGTDVDGNPANPSIATVVFCRLWVDEEWVDSMVVGLHCIGSGSILPFYEDLSGEAMGKWKNEDEDLGIIRAMAVIPDKYLLGYYMQHGHGFPDAMVLWSLKNPGVLLCCHRFWDPKRSLMKQMQTRLDSVCGISVSGNDVLFACYHGDRIAAVTVEDTAGNPCLKLHGYGNIGKRGFGDAGEGFHGRMAMGGRYAVMGNANYKHAWIFDIGCVASHAELDRQEGDPRNFEHSNNEEKILRTIYKGREIAVGKISFPLFGDAEAEKKTQNKPTGWAAWTFDSSNIHAIDSDEEDGGLLGEGGPLAFAFKGKFLVAGFANGSIVRAPNLPDKFDNINNQMGSNERVSCSSLSSCEWRCSKLGDAMAGQEGPGPNEQVDIGGPSAFAIS